MARIKENWVSAVDQLRAQGMPIMRACVEAGLKLRGRPYPFTDYYKLKRRDRQEQEREQLQQETLRLKEETLRLKEDLRYWRNLAEEQTKTMTFLRDSLGRG